MTLAAVQLETPTAVWTADYGHVLLIKLALVVALLLLAAVNRWRLTGEAEAGDRAAAQRLVRTILLEVLLATAILGTVAIWRFTPPPRALQAAAAASISIHIHTAKAIADVKPAPGRVGPVVASIYVQTGDFGPLDAKEVTLTLSNPSAGIEPIRRLAVRQGDASWSVDDLVVPVAGRWQVEVALLISEFELVRLQETVNVP